MKRRIKVLQVVNYLGLAGMERGVVQVANALPPDEFETIICVLVGSAPGIERIVDPAVRIVRLGKNRGVDPRTGWQLARLSKGFGADIVHSHNWGTYVYLAMAQWFGAQGCFVHGEHGRDTAELQISLARRLFIKGTKRKVSRFTFVARHLGEEFGRAWRLPERQLVVLPNGVDLSRFRVEESRAEIRASLGIPETALVIGSVGNHRPIKGFPTIYAAASQLAGRYQDVAVVVCGANQTGRGVSFKELQEDVSRQCAPARAILLNSRPDVERVLRAYDIFVNSSYLEGMSNAILEAMASDCPVLASDIPGNREILSGGALNNLFPAGDAGALALQIALLLDDSVRRADLVREQSAWVSREFSADISIRRYIDFYRSLVESGGRVASGN